MAILTTKTFSDRLASIKSVFEKTIEKADSLRQEIDNAVESKHEQIVQLTSEIHELGKTRAAALQFATKLKELIK